ncbi:Signal transduction histidine kinase [Thermomonospora echinospora]|uniref:histidine kinase n=1 Tax=Thermomonospora echinospora TaxID=1992 RepID=A0A1H5YWE7_9ACTN|nr:sensor histidine kinase [Thermomonospora echinospora]SEG28102.1 Signal transduction histidine kinase [Thermomonospora echinospora]
MVRRAWAWWRAHKALVDLVFVAPLLLVSVLSVSAYTAPPHGAPAGPIPEPVYAALVAGLLLPLVVRRRWPVQVFLWIAAVSFGQWLFDVTVILANMGVLIAMYTVAANCSFRWMVTAGLIGELGAVLAALRYTVEPGARKYTVVMLSAVVAGVWILGVYISTRRAYLRSLEERAARLERERDTQVQIAMAAERARIARELHDVVAHNVSVIVVQADGASFAIETDTERARRALEAISATGRLALAEMRRLLGVLREGDDAGSYAPQPGVAQLTDLVEQIRGSGLPLDFRVEGVPVELPPGMQLTIFRIVQESLTNTLKHGGPGASARVRLHYGDEAIEVTVADDGRGAAARDDGLGHGLAGMRERAAVYGGSVRAGPRAGGGFEVVARLPLREEARST